MARGSDIASRFDATLTVRRNRDIEDAVRAGEIVPIEWETLPVSHTFHDGSTISGKIYVAKHALRLGEHGDCFRPTPSHPSAQRIADMLVDVPAANAPKGCVLPTAKIMDLSAMDSKVIVEPCIQSSTGDMMSTKRMLEHSSCIDRSIAGRCGMTNQEGKGWVNTVKLDGRPGKSANYGLYADDARHRGVLGTKLWQPGPGTAHISGLASTSWAPAGYTDYSQGIERLVRIDMWVDGRGEMDIREVALDPKLCWLVSSEGPVRMRHPGVPAPGGSPEPEIDHPEESILHRTLRYRLPMMRGEDVAFVQRLVGSKPDGWFGPKTKALVAQWQRKHVDSRGRSLAVDGIVGPKTREAMLREVGVAEDPSDPIPDAIYGYNPLSVPLVPARYFTRSKRSVVHWIVLHSAEASELPTTAEALQRYAANMPDGRLASWHWAFDCDSATRSVEEAYVAWHAKKANRFGVGYEHAGYARQSRSDWLDEYSEAMLWISAKTAARVTIPNWDLPADNVVDAAGLKRAYEEFIDQGKPVPNELRGFTTHEAVSRGLGGTHVDPGDGFPMDAYLEMVRDAA